MRKYLLHVLIISFVFLSMSFIHAASIWCWQLHMQVIIL